MRSIQNKNIAIAKGINLSKNTRKQWWSGKVKGITRNDWEYSFTVEGDPTIYSKDEDMEIIPDIMIGPLEKIQATLIVSPPLRVNLAVLTLRGHAEIQGDNNRRKDI